MFTIVNGTKFKEAIGAAINLDSDFEFNLKFNSNFKSYSANAVALSINSIPISIKYVYYTDNFKEKEIVQLSLHHPAVDYEIASASSSKPVYGSIYNLSELKLCYLKEYIN